MPKFKPALHDNLLSHEQQALVTVNAISDVWRAWADTMCKSNVADTPLDEAIRRLYTRGKELEFYYSGYQTAKNEEKSK